MDALRIAVADFLHALDRGDYGPAPLHHGASADRAESAHVTALREALQAERRAPESSRNLKPKQAAA